jgi:hypothetical protein
MVEKATVEARAASPKRCHVTPKTPSVATAMTAASRAVVAELCRERAAPRLAPGGRWRITPGSAGSIPGAGTTSETGLIQSRWSADSGCSPPLVAGDHLRNDGVLFTISWAARKISTSMVLRPSARSSSRILAYASRN